MRGQALELATLDFQAGVSCQIARRLSKGRRRRAAANQARQHRGVAVHQTQRLIQRKTSIPLRGLVPVACNDSLPKNRVEGPLDCSDFAFILARLVAGDLQFGHGEQPQNDLQASFLGTFPQPFLQPPDVADSVPEQNPASYFHKGVEFASQSGYRFVGFFFASCSGAMTSCSRIRTYSWANCSNRR